MTLKPEGIVSQRQAGSGSGALKAAWRGWLRFVEIFGTVLMVIMLTVVYWTLVAVMAWPFKLFSDPMMLKGPRFAQWTRRSTEEKMLDAMKMQF
jgi:hypothetical protein